MRQSLWDLKQHPIHCSEKKSMYTYLFYLFCLITRRREEITLSRAPQILTINHDEAEEVSGNEVSTEESEDEGLNLLEDRSETPLEETREKELIKAFRGEIY